MCVSWGERERDKEIYKKVIEGESERERDRERQRKMGTHRMSE